MVEAPSQKGERVVGKCVELKTQMGELFEQSGNCQRGEAGTYVHSARAIDGVGWGRGSGRGRGNGGGFKRQACKFFMQSGSCRYGVACNYAHGVHQTVGMSESDGKAGEKSTGYQAQVHKFPEQSGNRQRGEACTYEYGVHEIGRSSIAGDCGSGGRKSDNFKMQKCKLFGQSGSCSYSGHCVCLFVASEYDLRSN